jgi:hypothetical protein
MWWTLEKKRVPTKYITLIKNMLTNVVTCIRECDDESDTFFIKIRLHQGSALSPIYLMLSDWVSFLAYPNLFGIKGFVVVVVVGVVMDEITKDIQ